MGKKDAQGSRSSLVDQYRKQIGKQDWKKSKNEIKSSKRKAAETSSLWGVKEVTMILITFLTLIAGTYFFLYWQLDTSKSGESSQQT